MFSIILHINGPSTRYNTSCTLLAPTAMDNLYLFKSNLNFSTTSNGIIDINSDTFSSDKHLVVNNNSNNVLNKTSQHFKVKHTECTIAATLHKFTFDSFIRFVQAFVIQFTPKSSSATHHSYIYSILRLYISMYFIHDSKMLLNIYRSSECLNIPPFLIAYINNICIQIESSNKVIGITYGTISPSSNFKEVVNDIITDLSNPDSVSGTTPILNLISMSGLYSRTSNRDLKDLRVSLLNNFQVLSNAISDSPDIDEHITCIFDPFISIKTFIQNPSYELIPYNLTYRSVSHLGIYRFRKESDGFYITNQNVLGNINESSFNLFCCFLRLFGPTYFINDLIAPNHTLGQDIVLDIGSSSRYLAYKYIFTIIFNTSPKPVKKSRQGSSGSIKQIPSGFQYASSNPGDRNKTSETVVIPEIIKRNYSKTTQGRAYVSFDKSVSRSSALLTLITSDGEEQVFFSTSKTFVITAAFTC